MQLAGATTGVAFVKAVDTSRYNLSGGGANELAPGINRASGWLMETILTGALVYMVFAAVDPIRQQTTAHIPVCACPSPLLSSMGFALPESLDVLLNTIQNQGPIITPAFLLKRVSCTRTFLEKVIIFKRGNDGIETKCDYVRRV